jgi:hypothetical protein
MVSGELAGKAGEYLQFGDEECFAVLRREESPSYKLGATT